VPVIALVDFGRMCGVELRNEGERTVSLLGESPVFSGDNSFYVTDEMLKNCRRGTPRVRRHAVLVAGCKTARGGKSGDALEFLANDPTTAPFLQINTRQLAQGREYHEELWKEKKADPIQFISVTPQEVRLPLMDLFEDFQIRPGLLSIAAAMQADETEPWFDALMDGTAEVRLVDLRWWATDCDIYRRMRRRLRHVPKAAKKALASLLQSKKIPAKWCWLRYGPSTKSNGDGVDSIWIWDATVPPPLVEIPVASDEKKGDSGCNAVAPPRMKISPEQLREFREKYLLGILVKENGAWQLTYGAVHKFCNASMEQNALLLSKLPIPVLHNL
jgi:hypothetical protein